MITCIAGKLDGNLAGQEVGVAVDLGFGQAQTRSTGLAWHRARRSPEIAEFSFGAAIERCAKIQTETGEAVMILEAPLSCAFDSGGNPMPRRSIRQDMKLANWNVALPIAPARRRPLREWTDAIAADVWVLTETHDGFMPGHGHSCKSAAGRDGQHESGHR